VFASSSSRLGALKACGDMWLRLDEHNAQRWLLNNQVREWVVVILEGKIGANVHDGRVLKG